MHRKRARVIVRPTLVALLALTGIVATPLAAQATASTIAWPSNLNIATPYAHGDNSLTLAVQSDCTVVNSTDTTSSEVTYDTDYTTSYALAKNGTDGWSTTDCRSQEAVGIDKTLYIVEKLNTSNYMQRIVALHGSAVLWTQSFYGQCPGYGQIYNPTIGFDGNVYAEVNCNTSSASARRLAKLDAATGYEDFWVQLPSGNDQLGIVNDDIMPYSTGLAVANSSSNIYYYGYDGTQDSSDTFTPPDASGGAVIVGATTSADGRTYVTTQKYTNVGGVWQYVRHVYYKNVSNATINEITAPTGASLSSGIQVTPSDGVAINLARSTGDTYLGYFNSSGTEVYEVDLTNNAGESERSGSPFYTAVDNLGNVITVRTINGSKQEVYVDSFSPTGTKTRLFDSAAEFGTSGTDVFTIGPWSSQSIGDGKIYLTLCHQVNPSGGWPTTCPASGGSPQVVVIPTTSQFDYPRSEIFNAPNQYVALGDSFSSGEGNSPFIAPSDTDGCHRSPQAYAPYLALSAGASLRAFVACSGATSDEVYTGMSGEPSQLFSLNSKTTIVTVTSGGDDAGFPSFAMACVNPLTNCGTDSDAYATAMDYVSNYLQANLELLYSRIRAAAPNATVYVVGYPQVAPEPGGTCTFFTDSEKTAARNLVTALNAKALAAADSSGTGFVFVDPTATGSPFTGHELCTSDSYFNNLSWPTEYSFHPNGDGQFAYAELIYGYLS